MSKDRPLTKELNAALERILRSYEAYYTVRRDGPPPFAAEAVFHAHGERYFLTKRARYAELDSHEYVFFAAEPVLTPERVRELSRTAWEEGMARAEPGPNHRASDVLLIILTEDLIPSVRQTIRRTRFSRSYRLGLWGYSHFRLAVLEPVALLTACNPMGDAQAKHLTALFRP